MTQTRTTIPARDLRPGMIVLTEDGFRRFAAFDVDVQHTDQAEALTVTVWTAVSDQDRGVDPVLALDPAEEVTVGEPLEVAPHLEAVLSSDEVTTALRAGGVTSGTTTTVPAPGVVRVALSRPVARLGAAVLFQAGYVVAHSDDSTLYVTREKA
jgi:hypothetical protein